MLKTPKDFSYDTLVDSLSGSDYKIAANDALVVKISGNNGFRLVNLDADPTKISRNEVETVVESDGTVKVPLVGYVSIAGLTIKQAEELLEKRYAEFYIEPYISVRVTNRRVIVFPGNGGSAKVLSLSNNNISVLEAIASSGGILEDGKAYKVKLIRNNVSNNAKPSVFLMDLSRIEGITMGRSSVQAGDIIYVEPRYRPLSTFTKEIAPIITLVTSALILYQFTKLIK
mgnify:FL=1